MTKKQYWAWSIWLLSALFMCYKYAIEVSPSVMTTHLMGEFRIDGAQLGNLAACYLYAYLIMQIPAGLLVDRFGPRKVTSIAVILCALGSILLSYASDLWIAQAGRFLAGFGAAFAALNCLKLTANWFAPSRFAFMAGLMMSLGMLGAVSGQAPLSSFIDHMGWRSSLFVIGLTGLFLSAIFWLVVRDHPTPHWADRSQVNPQGASIWQSCKSVFKSRQSWLLSIYSGLAFAPVSAFGGLWGISFISEGFHLSQRDAAYTVSLLFIGFAIGAPFWGWLSDFMGNRKRGMQIGTLLSAAAFSAILYSPSLPIWALSLLMIAFGFFLSSFLICFTMIREINAPIVAATAIGFMNSFDALLGAISEPLTGKLLDMGWTGTTLDGARIFSAHAYKWALTTIPISLVGSCILLFFIKETFCKSTYPNAIP